VFRIQNHRIFPTSNPV